MNNILKTDNIPLLDNVVHYLKRLATECIIKNPYQSELKESLDSRKNYDLYKMCYIGTARYTFFDYDYEDLIQTSVSPTDMYDILEDKMKANSKIQDELLEVKKKEIIENYVETNDYYRMLNGQPDVNDLDEILVSEEYLTDDDLVAINPYIPIHLMTIQQQDFLNSVGITDIYIQKYPNKKYLKFLGSKKIDIFTARNTAPFGMLYMPIDGIPVEVYSRWQEKYNINRVFTIKTIYDHEAFIDENDHYDDFIAMFIVIQTMVDIISELPDFIIKRDIFDLGMIRLILKSYDVDYFSNIPLNYQQAIVRNINKLVEFKSTSQSIVNICSLFGCDNIEVFKYYLFKTRKLDDDGNFIFNENELDNYQFKFIKCPIDGNIDDYIHDKGKYLIYDDVTLGDKWWDGGLDHEKVEKAIMEQEFNYLQSKYYSVDCVFSMTEILFKLVYFYNMFFDDVFSEELLRVRLFNISNRFSFKLVDVFCYLFGLGYVYYGLEDTITFDQSKILYVKGFDFDVDMDQLNEWVYERTQHLKDLKILGVDKFKTFEEGERILTFKQLSDIFLNNKDIYEHVVHEMLTADNKRIYDLYKKMFDSMMINELSSKFFEKKNGEVASSFTDFLKDRDSILYESLIGIKQLENPEDRQQMASTMIDDVIYVLEHQYLTDKAFEKIYKCFPTADADSIIVYIKEMVDFFKSYKMQLDQINIIYLLDDKYENWCGAIDDVLLTIKLGPTACNSDKDFLKTRIETALKDKNEVDDKVYILLNYFKNKIFLEKGSPDEKLKKNIDKQILEDAISWDYLKINQTYN